MTDHDCFRCGRSSSALSTRKMCPACMTMWLSATPTERRALMHVVPQNGPES